MQIEFTKHAELKMKERLIDHSDVIEILKQPEEVFLDTETGNIVFTGKFHKKQSHILIIVLSYDMKKVITIIDTSKADIINKRKEKSRWIKIK